MRRQGHYGDSGGNAYVAARMQQVPGERMEQRSGYYQGRPEPLTSEKEHSYGTSKAEGQMRWERDGSKMPNSMSSHMFSEGQGGDTSRSYYQGQRPDLKMGLEKQGNNDRRSQHHEEDMDVGYDDNIPLQTFDGLEQKFVDDIMKLTKEQTDAEDAENARHRERINTINAQYQEQLAAVRARHSSRRDEFLRRESQARQQQYQQSAMDRYPNSGMDPSESHGYGLAAAPTGEPQRSYSADQYESYRERARFHGNSRDQELEPRGPYPGGRVYDSSSRYY